jgi:hypothetical protein
MPDADLFQQLEVSNRHRPVAKRSRRLLIGREQTETAAARRALDLFQRIVFDDFDRAMAVRAACVHC